MKYSRHEIGIKKFGVRVKEIRQQKGLSQEQLAWETGLEFSQINRIENGKINTSISNLFIIAEALKVEPSELLKFKI
ncbi:MAG: helix-turn-helix transcriptional regulator [Bacteroidetes bacterium]|nr:helix-turn-helix transcriptional regulator [Bacteroidota bacterium]